MLLDFTRLFRNLRALDVLCGRCRGGIRCCGSAPLANGYDSCLGAVSRHCPNTLAAAGSFFINFREQTRLCITDSYWRYCPVRGDKIVTLWQRRSGRLVYQLAGRVIVQMLLASLDLPVAAQTPLESTGNQLCYSVRAASTVKSAEQPSALALAQPVTLADIQNSRPAERKPAAAKESAEDQ